MQLEPCTYGDLTWIRVGGWLFLPMCVIVIHLAMDFEALRTTSVVDVRASS